MRPALLLAVLSLAAVLSSCSTPSEDCGPSFCGCWKPVTLVLDGRVVDAQSGAPVPGVTLTCLTDDAGVGTTDADGGYALRVDTSLSPGCGYAGCNQVRFDDPAGTYQTSSATIFELQDADGGMSLSRR
jgi:hypothetical protein